MQQVQRVKRLARRSSKVTRGHEIIQVILTVRESDGKVGVDL